MGAVTVRDATEGDLAAIADIQNALLATTTIEWTTTPHTVEERGAWLARQRAAGYPAIVAVDGDDVVGFAGFGDFRDISKWPGYRFTVEHTVHVRESHWGSGVGRTLILELAERARALGKHVLIAAVDAENDGSVRFHERLGFVEVGRLPQVGSKLGRWLEVVFLALRLDDRPVPPPG